MAGCMHDWDMRGGGACTALETATEAGGTHPIKSIKCILVCAKLSPV